MDDAGKAAVNGEIDRAHVRDGRDVDRLLGREQVVRAEQDEMPVDVGGYAAARIFLHGVHVRVVCAAAALGEGAEDRTPDGMRGVAFCVCRVEEHLLLAETLCGDNARDMEAALREGARLVKDDGVCIGKRLEVVAALDEDAGAACTADAGKEGERHGDDERTRAGDDEEGQGAVDPHGEGISGDERRHNRKDDRCDHDDRRVPACKARDERLGRRLLVRRLLDEGENALDRRLLVGGCHFDLEHARLVDAAADDLIARMCLTRHGFTGQRGGVEQAVALCDDAVERNALAGADDDRLAHLDLIGEDLLLGAAAQNACRVGANVHERGDRAARALDRIGLEPLADLVEQHDGDALRVVAERECTDSCNRHEEIFIKDASVADVHRGAPEDVPADQRVGCEEENHAGHALLEDHAGDKERRRTADAPEHALLLFRHGRCSFSLRLEHGVRLDGLDDLLNLLEHGIELVVVCVERHALAQEIDAHLVHTGNLRCCFLDLLCAVAAVEFANSKCFFHEYRLLYIEHSNNI